MNARPDFVDRTGRGFFRLRREISATYITNSLINRAGPSFINEMREKTGASPAEITKAYLITRQVFGMHVLWSRIEALDNKIPAKTQTAMNMDILRLTRRGTLWMLRHGDSRSMFRGRSNDTSRASRSWSNASMRGFPPTSRRCAQGSPRGLAAQIAGLDAMFSGYDIVRIAAAGGPRVADVARVYFTIGERFGLDWLRDSAESLNTETEWQVMAVLAIIDDLYAQQMALSTKVVHEAGSAAADAVIDAWAAANDNRVTRAENIVEELKSSAAVDLAMLAVANREIRSLLAR